MATFTKEQQLAIDAQGKTLVSASAGSGKTTVMIEKIIRWIKAGGEVREILAVTFTKKAASQMKEKLSKALIEEINAPDSTPERRAFLKRQLSETAMADISTIHSFCAKLLRSNFYLAGVDSDFRVIGSDDSEGMVLQNEALDETFEDGYESHAEEFSHLLSVYWRKKSDKKMREVFLDTYQKLRNRADYLEYLEKSCRYDESVFEEIIKDLKKSLDDKCRYYYELVEDERVYFMEEEKSPQRNLCDDLMGFLEEIQSQKDYFSAYRIQKPKFTMNSGLKKLSPEKLASANRIAFLKGRIVKDFDSVAGELRSYEEEKERFLLSSKTASAFAAYMVAFDKNYERLKAERGVLDYNDLEHKSLKLLELKEVAEALQKKYSYVFVDEYQDVNPVQEKLIDRLSGENLFLVGDVKQAIYGFRGSKSAYFVQKQKAFAEGGGNSLYMSRNFRSSDKVLDAVNEQFLLAMTPKVCGVDYARGSVMEKGGRYATNDGKVCIHFLGKEETKEKEKARGVYSVREESGIKEDKESQFCKKISQIIEEERKSKFFDADKGEYRDVRYSDIAILSRKKSGQIAKTVEELSKRGIPVTSVSAVNICDFTEIKLLIDLLSLIDNAEQDVPLCSVLLSSVGGLTADALASIRLAYPKERFFRKASRLYAQEKEDLTAKKLCRFYEYFDKIRHLSRVLDAGELLLKILSDTRMEAEILTKVNGMSALKRIRRFIEETNAVEPLCVHAFLQRLRDLDYKIYYNENGGEDSVKVLTMHSSKGLEYPIVILDNLSMPFRGVDNDEVCVEEKYGLAPYAFYPESMTKHTTVLRRLHRIKEEESSKLDDLNLYYVALTRAKYGLHMIFTERTVMADVKYAHSFAEFTNFSVWDKYVVDERDFEIPKLERTALVFRPDETLTREIMQAFVWEYGYKGFENLPVKSSATQLLSDFVETGSASRSEALLEGIEGLVLDAQLKTNKEKGLAYHAFLERFDFSLLRDEKGEKISPLLLKECVIETLNGMGRDEVKLLSVDKLLEILQNPVFFSLQGKRLYKEQQFLVSLPVSDTYAKKEGVDDALLKAGNEEIIFQGAVDLLAVGEDGEGWIIDYKYSQSNAEHLRSRYQPQLDLYRRAVSKIMKIPMEKIKCAIVNIYHGFQVDLY